MDILNTNWKNYADLASTNPTDAHGLKEDFLAHCLPIFASISWVRNSDNKIDVQTTLQPLQKSTIPIKTPNGNITGENLISLMSFIFRINRSKFLSKSMTKDPIYGTFTPLVMYANKLYNNIGYDEYEVKNNAWVALILGNKMLAEILKIEIVPKLDIKKVASLRDATLTYASGAKAGQMAAVTLNKMRIKSIDKQSYPPAAMYMYLQIWLANSQLRDTKAMILDPTDWGKIPDSWDGDRPNTPSVKEDHIGSKPLDEWDIL